MMIPKRIQRKRARGWKMPPNTVYVGRPSKWGNPFKPDSSFGLRMCVRMYRTWIEIGKNTLRDELSELRGKNLACWCPLDQPCHADILLELANR